MAGNVLSQEQLANSGLSYLFPQGGSSVCFKGYARSLLNSLGPLRGKILNAQNSIRMNDLYRVHDKEPDPTSISMNR